jgi:hypothetical protein
MRAFLVGLHQATVGRDVTDNDGCETTRPYAAVRRRLVMIPGSEVANFAHCGALHRLARGSPSLRRRGNIVCEGYHIDELEQCRGIAGIEFQGVTARLCLNLPGATYD